MIISVVIDANEKMPIVIQTPARDVPLTITEARWLGHELLYVASSIELRQAEKESKE